jgi:hypothetical protein
MFDRSGARPGVGFRAVLCVRGFRTAFEVSELARDNEKLNKSVNCMALEAPLSGRDALDGLIHRPEAFSPKSALLKTGLEVAPRLAVKTSSKTA